MRLPVVGQGTRTDPYRVALPTYNLIDVDYDAGVALVDVPESDLPRDDVHRAVVSAHRFERVALPAELHALAVDAWHAHLDDRYREHAGRFRPIPL